MHMANTPYTIKAPDMHKNMSVTVGEQAPAFVLTSSATIEGDAAR